MHYMGYCPTCKTEWRVELKFEGSHYPPDLFDVECPLFLCGVVELRKVKQ